MSYNIYHIGYHKTASSYFQMFIFPHMNSILEDRGVKVLTSEGFSGSLTADNLNFARELYEKEKYFKVIVFIRSQFSWLRSAYWTYIKSGCGESFESFVDKAIANGKCRYDRLVQSYLDYIDLSDILIIPYEEFKTDSVGVINKLKSFTDLFNVEIPSPVKQVNKTPTDGYIELMRYLSFHFPNRSSWVQRFFVRFIQLTFLTVQKPFEMMNIPVWKIDYESQREKIEKFYGDSNRRLMDLSGLPLSNYGYPGCDA